MSSALDVIFFFAGFLSAGLSFSTAYLMLVSFRTIRSEYLLGFPIGFSFLGLSYAFFGISHILPMLADLASWLHLFLGSYGLAFLASSYLLKKGSVSSSSSGQLARWSLLALIVLGAFTVLIVVLSTSIFPPYQLADALFRALNLGLLGYIIYSLNQALRTEVELSNVVLGFTFLTIEQYSLFLWTLDREFAWSFVFAQFVRVAGLAILTAFVVRGFQRK